MCQCDKMAFVAKIYFVFLLLYGIEAKVQDPFIDFLNPEKEDLEVWHQRNARVAIPTNEELKCEKPNFYICEEPPNVVSRDSNKTCNYRNVNYHEQVYRWVAGRGCIFYTHEFLFKEGRNPINLNGACFYYANLWAPCLEIPKADGTCGCYPFDPGFEEVLSIVQDAMIPSAQGRWERCFEAANDCCTNYMGEQVIYSQEQCGPTFDAWSCWQPTDPGALAEQVCSDLAYSNIGPSCHHYSSKKCFENGTWEAQTDYTTCSIRTRLELRYTFHIGMLAFSIISCVPAVIIFFFYKRLRVTRVELHRNLLISIIVRNVLLIVIRSEIHMNEIAEEEDTAMSRNSVACRTLTFFEKAAVNAVFVCMLVEGIYLHRLIVAVFKKQMNVMWIYVIGFVVAEVPVIAWTVVMAVHNDHSCWLIYSIDNVQWILDAPRVAILVVNTILFIDVLRVLLTKIRNAENANQLSATKTSLFLMPLFGTQFLLTAFRPNTTNCAAEESYYFITYTVEGLQGFIVAMLYCYINKEVRTLIKTTYVKTETAVVSRYRRDSNYPRMSVDPRFSRRFTYSTTANSQHDDPKENAEVAPKLHVAEITSIQASERLADIQEPVYETIENGVINEGYDSLERSNVVNDSGFTTKRDSTVENNYNFTNASSVSIDCQDWIKRESSPLSSVYNNSLSDYETKYLERKFPNRPKLKENDDDKSRSTAQNHMIEAADKQEETVDSNKNDHSIYESKESQDVDDSDYEDGENINNNMLFEIMQYIKTNDDNPVKLSPNVLSPNRKDDDAIIFVDD